MAIRSQQITSIIEKRQPLVKRLEQTEAQLERLSLELQNLSQEREQVAKVISDETVISQLRKVDFTNIQRNIQEELEALKKLKNRFSRPTLNIGVVGRARQGKSKLLQSLTGLSSQEIPDGELLQCTGVRSTIYHNANSQKAAEVIFHTEQSFIKEIITPYYHQLGLGTVPYSLKYFMSVPLPNPSKQGSELNAKYEHLKKYHDHFNQYKHLISAPPLSIKSEQIREYVAQDSPDGKSNYFNFLAVKEVKIFCSFPNTEVGKLALVDMPGLGDTGVGDAERMIKTLGQDIDFVLFVRRPRSGGDDWFDFDTQLYDTANQALTELPIKEWSFMVLNRDGGNSRLCEIFAEKMPSKHIDVQRTIIANCADEAEANEKILDAVLDYLTTRIDVLDKEYASAFFDRIKQLNRHTEQEISAFVYAFSFLKSEDGMAEFNERFSSFWNDFRVQLHNLLLELIEKRDCDDHYLQQGVEKVIQKCRENTEIIPTKEKVEERNKLTGGYGIAYEEYLHEIRTALSKEFLELEPGLKSSLEEIKTKVVDALAHQKLDKLVEKHEAVYASVFLKAVTALIPEGLEKIKLGFHILADFDLVYRGLVQHRIRKHLDVLTPNKTKYKLSNSLADEIFNKNQPVSEKIVWNLQKAYAEAVNNCERELGTLLKEPSQAGFAIVEEFVDRVIRAEGVENQWRDLLWRERSKVWPEAFKRMEEIKSLIEQAKRSAAQAIAANQ